MIVTNLINRLQTLIAGFSQKTDALAYEFEENKKTAEWTITYSIIKLQFVLTRKEKVVCPIATLFCRVYLGKNETYFYHLPELMEYLEPDNFKCYYFPYIESETRLEACFGELAAFLEKNLAAIHTLAKDAEKSEQIRAAKIDEIKTLFLEDTPAKEMEEYVLSSYETYVLLLRFAGEGAYREFVCGNSEKAQKLYAQMEEKGTLTSYEKRLYDFLKDKKEEYQSLPESCNAICHVKKISSPSAEGKSILITALGCELIFGMLFAGIVAVINAVLSMGTLYYAGMQWYYGFLFAGVPALFGGMAFRNHSTSAFERLVNPQWVKYFAQAVFGIAFVGMLFVCFCTSFMSSRFYEGYMTYNVGEELFPIENTTCTYTELKQVYYSKGVYNDYGDFIDRPSYLFEFEDGTVWDSDVCTSVKEVEKHILPIIEEYYDEIITIEARNELIEQ